MNKLKYIVSFVLYWLLTVLDIITLYDIICKMKLYFKDKNIVLLFWLLNFLDYITFSNVIEKIRMKLKAVLDEKK